jgi:hypothetical protein
MFFQMKNNLKNKIYHNVKLTWSKIHNIMDSYSVFVYLIFFVIWNFLHFGYQRICFFNLIFLC